ncbi:carbohydrate porin [Myxococcota bacterium]|nr:carbohydrate porin [Myxococcota bacterium]
MLLRLLLILLGSALDFVVVEPASAHPLHGRGHPRRPEGLMDPVRVPRVSAEEDSALGRWLTSERMTGEWMGARSWLRDRGIEFEGSYTADLSRPFRGGVHQDTAYRHWADLNGTFDVEKLAGLPGATVFFDAYSIWGDFGTRDVGDFQLYSNIDNPTDRLQLAELWWQQTSFGGALRLKFGKLDANSEFAFVDAGGDFLNSSAGFSPTIFTMVTYPDPGMGALAFVDPEGPFYAGVGVFDGATAATGAKIGKRGPKTFFQDSSDHLVIGEIGANWQADARVGPGRLAAGPWYHSAQFERWDGSSAGQTGGFFALFGQRVVRLGPEREEGTRDVRVFGQYGWSEPDISPAHHHASLGFLLTGPFAVRASDTAGMMVNWVDLADQQAAGFTADETSLEVFYRLQLTPFFSLKPDLQTIDNPGGVHADTVWVGTMRFEIGL